MLSTRHISDRAFSDLDFGNNLKHILNQSDDLLNSYTPIMLSSIHIFSLDMHLISFSNQYIVPQQMKVIRADDFHHQNIRACS